MDRVSYRDSQLDYQNKNLNIESSTKESHEVRKVCDEVGMVIGNDDKDMTRTWKTYFEVYCCVVGQKDTQKM